MRVEAASIEELIAKAPRGEDLAAVDDLIVSVAPHLRRQLFSGPSITMIGYGEIEWTTMSSSGLWPLIAVAPQKHQTSVYVAADVDGTPLVQAYEGRLGRTNNGKKCVRFTRFANLDTEGFADLVREAMAVAEDSGPGHGRNCAQPVTPEDSPQP